MLELLRPDFPAITISKIRFLEAEGLVSPRRTPSGYRSFGEDDVDRLRFVLTAQRDRFWPLRVIREALDARDRGLDVGVDSATPEVPGPGPDEDVPSVTDLLEDDDRDLRLTRRELERSAKLDPEMLDALVTYGLLAPDREGHFDTHALRIATAAAGLAVHGLEARHLRPFRTAAEREIGLVHQISAPARGRSDEAGRKVAADVLHHCIALHTALVKSGL